jgi:uncharacterized protein (DUF1501 family)
MHILKDTSRRVFLRQASAMTALVGSTAAPLALNLAAMSNASAQAPGGYKAIVCLFLFGGSDNINLLLPTDAASFGAYTATRNQAPDSIALLAAGTVPNPAAGAGTPARLGGVLPISPLNPQGRGFAIHPMMGDVKRLFDTDKRVAFVPNIGPLVLPTTKLQVGQATHPKPARLYSHNDQQNTWQSLGPEGTTLGWGGRIGDIIAGGNTRAVFTSISAAGNAVFLSGESVKQYQVSTNGAIILGQNTVGQVYGSTDIGAALHRVVTTPRSTHPIDVDVAAVSVRAIEAEANLRSSLKPASDPLFGTPPAAGVNYSQANDPKLRYVNPVSGATVSSGLAQQFQVVARLIEAGLSGGTGATRQVFFVSLGGFDTHDNQNRDQPDLMARINHALAYFDATLGGLNARDKVTTFTASDFGRTFTSNGDGTDHGWGSHHLVMGGAVKGGDLYGTFPTYGPKNTNNNNFDSSPDQLGNGVLLPTTSVDQLGATLARWMGLTDGQIATIFPNLANWDITRRDLGFML